MHPQPVRERADVQYDWRVCMRAGQSELMYRSQFTEVKSCLRLHAPQIDKRHWLRTLPRIKVGRFEAHQRRSTVPARIAGRLSACTAEINGLTCVTKAQLQHAALSRAIEALQSAPARASRHVRDTVLRRSHAAKLSPSATSAARASVRQTSDGTSATIRNGAKHCDGNEQR